MKAASDVNWLEANQRYLTAAIALLRRRLECHIARAQGKGQPATSEEELRQAQELARSVIPAPPALEVLCVRFGLSVFEHDLLLLCAATELDSRFPALCAQVHGEPMRSYPTFSLALAALPEPHWSALAPDATLRRWRLVEVGPGNSVTLSPLKIDERVLHYLTGVSARDERLAGIVEPVRHLGLEVPSHQALAGRIGSVWSQASRNGPLPIVQLCGPDVAGRRGVAAAVCSAAGIKLSLISAGALPLAPGELDTIARLWERESILGTSALLLECDDIDAADLPRKNAVNQFLEHVDGILLISARERWQTKNRPFVVFDVTKPTVAEQRDLWRRCLGPEAARMNGSLDALVAQFSLSAHAIDAVCAETAAAASDRGDALWDACRRQARPKLEDLAQRVEAVAGWDDIVLPKPQLEILRDAAAQVRQRMKVYETWGFAAKSARGLGISVLLSGPSGTGKTLAAEVLANHLKLDLYRIDLSQVVSKYIGETEKNLRRVFDAAEDGGAVLLFDEADALFGKRSEVKDSHDRYANIEVSYLLQRMEGYRGLAILTTNMKEALDQAFLRRIRFVVQFPFPDAEQRAEIWRRVYPAATPINGLDFARLARLDVAGGNIRNIALYAAFLAAEAGESVAMKHLRRAAQVEYAKLERPMVAEVGNWQ